MSGGFIDNTDAQWVMSAGQLHLTSGLRFHKRPDGLYDWTSDGRPRLAALCGKREGPGKLMQMGNLLSEHVDTVQEKQRPHQTRMVKVTPETDTPPTPNIQVHAIHIKRKRKNPTPTTTPPSTIPINMVERHKDKRTRCGPPTQTILHEYRDTVLFHKHSELFGELSNWFPSRFRLDAVNTYTSGEQMLMHQKALMFMDLETAQAILDTDIPALQKQQGRKVKGFDEKEWSKYRHTVLLDCLRCKFSQNPDLAVKLMDTHPRHLAEASPSDQIYGIGLRATDPRAYDPRKWRGHNLLGSTLEQVRGELLDAERIRGRLEQTQYHAHPREQPDRTERRSPPPANNGDNGQHINISSASNPPPSMGSTPTPQTPQQQRGIPTTKGRTQLQAKSNKRECDHFAHNERVNWYDKTSGMWQPALVCGKKMRHDGSTQYKIFTGTGQDTWSTPAQLRPNKTPVFKKGAHVHWLCRRNGLWIAATVSNATNARMNEYEVITQDGEHKQTLAARLRPAIARLHTSGDRVWVRSVRTGHHATQATIRKQLPNTSQQSIGGLPYCRPHTTDINYTVQLPDGSIATAAQNDIESDTCWHKTGHNNPKPTLELALPELQGLASVEIRSAVNGWVPAFVVNNDGTPKHSYLVSRNGGPPGRVQAEDVRTRRKPDTWLASNDGHQATRLQAPMQHAMKRSRGNTTSGKLPRDSPSATVERATTLTKEERLGLTTVEVQSDMQTDWIPAFIVSSNSTRSKPTHYMVQHNGSKPIRVRANRVRARLAPEMWLGSNDGSKPTVIRHDEREQTTWCTPNALRPGLIQHGHTHGKVLCPDDADARHSAVTKQKCLQKRRRVNDTGAAEQEPETSTTSRTRTTRRKTTTPDMRKHDTTLQHDELLMEARLQCNPSTPVQTNQLTIVEKEKVRRRLFQYHCAAGHCSRKVLKQMLLRSQTESLRRLAKHINLLPICTACLVGKSRKKPHKQAADSRSKQYLHRLHIDITGRQRVASLGGNYYCMIIVDDATRKAWAFPMKKVTDAAAVLRRFLRTEVRQLNTDNTGPKVQTVRCDSGPEFASAEFEAVLAENSISWEPSPSDSSQARGVVERAIGTIVQIARVGMCWAKAPKTWWAEAILWATTTRNMTPTTANQNNAAPHTAATGKPVDTKMMRPFGCIALPNIPTIKMKGKMNAGARIAVMFGYALTEQGDINGYRVYNVATNRVTPNHDCEFNVDVPAMEHILASVLKSPLHYLLGKRVTKSFNGNEHHGTVVDTDQDEDSKRAIYGVKYDDGEQEDLFVEELLRHLDEDQPLDAARVQQLHRNVRPDGDQRWIFVPPGTDDQPPTSEDMDNNTPTTRTTGTTEQTTTTSGSTPATTSTTKTRHTAKTKNNSEQPLATTTTTPTTRKNLGVVHPLEPNPSASEDSTATATTDITTSAAQDEAKSENPIDQNSDNEPHNKGTPPHTTPTTLDSNSDDNKGTKTTVPTPNVDTETTANTRNKDPTTISPGQKHRYPLRNKTAPQQRHEPDAAIPVRNDRTMRTRSGERNGQTHGSRQLPPLQKWKTPRAVMTAVIGSHQRLADSETNDWTANNGGQRTCGSDPNLTQRPGKTPAPTFDARNFVPGDGGEFDFGSYVCEINAPIKYTVSSHSQGAPPSVPPMRCIDVPVPTDYWDAINGEFGVHWCAAIQKEIDNLLGHDVFREEKLPRGAKPIPGKFVLKVKPNADGTIASFKARWVCQGFRQRAGVDYQSTYAAVCSAISLRVLMSIACTNHWYIHNMDVSAAYLTAPLLDTTRMYIVPPPGIRVRRGYGLRLQRALYGTKQGGNRWAAHRDNKLADLGFTRSDAEPCLYHRLNADGYVLASVIVDDFIITGSSLGAIRRFKTELTQTWQMTDLGDLKWCLNLGVEYDREKGRLKITQTNYINEMIERYGLTEAHEVATPMVPGHHLSTANVPEADWPDVDPYPNMTGSLQHMRLTRPDICAALSSVCQFNKKGAHDGTHIAAVKRMLRYLKGTADLGIEFRSNGRKPGDPWELQMYVDSDYANDRVARRSKTGWLIFLNNNLVAFGSRLQTSTARSSTEAEYIAMSMAVKELLWVRNILTSIGFKVKAPIQVREDNQPAIELAKNAMASKRTRGMDIKHHWIRHYVDNGAIEVVYTHTSQQKADGMTKSLPKGPFLKFRDYVITDSTKNTNTQTTRQ